MVINMHYYYIHSSKKPNEISLHMQQKQRWNRHNTGSVTEQPNIRSVVKFRRVEHNLLVLSGYLFCENIPPQFSL